MDQQPNDKVSSVEEWTKLLKAFPFQHGRIDKLIANYLVLGGMKEAVETFTEEANVKPTISLACLDVRTQISELIRKGNGLGAGLLVETFFPGLLDEERLLKFQLLQLHVIELIGAGCLEDALHYAQKLPYEFANDLLEVSTEIERTLALLMYAEPLKCPYGVLLGQSHRETVARTANEAILKRSNPELQASAEVDNLVQLVLWCQNELSTGSVRFVKMKNIATATLEQEE